MWDYLMVLTNMWSIYSSESWFWTDHGASSVGIPEYGHDGRGQRAHGRGRPSRNDTVNQQETRNSWKNAAGIARSLAIYTHASRDAIILGLKMEKVCNRNLDRESNIGL